MKEKKENILHLMYKDNTNGEVSKWKRDFKWVTNSEIPKLKKEGWKLFNENST